jgi:ribosomal protein L22
MTEKDYNPERRNKKMVVETPKEKIEKMPIKKTTEEIKEEVKEEIKTEEKKESEKPEEKKKPIVKKEIIKKEEVAVNGKSIPISTKHSMAICKFLRGKNIPYSIEYLEKVITAKKAVPMKGEIPHRKGKMMSGRFPKSASIEFIKLLKSVESNARNNDINNPIITEAFANMASRPYGRFGRTRKKRTHITIRCREKKENNQEKKEKKNNLKK